MFVENNPLVLIPADEKILDWHKIGRELKLRLLDADHDRCPLRRVLQPYHGRLLPTRPG